MKNRGMRDQCWNRTLSACPLWEWRRNVRTGTQCSKARFTLIATRKLLPQGDGNTSSSKRCSRCKGKHEEQFTGGNGGPNKDIRTLQSSACCAALTYTPTTQSRAQEAAKPLHSARCAQQHVNIQLTTLVVGVHSTT